jgi:hypothetical protein
MLKDTDIQEFGQRVADKWFLLVQRVNDTRTPMPNRRARLASLVADEFRAEIERLGLEEPEQQFSPDL